MSLRAVLWQAIPSPLHVIASALCDLLAPRSGVPQSGKQSPRHRGIASGRKSTGPRNDMIQRLPKSPRFRKSWRGNSRPSRSARSPPACLSCVLQGTPKGRRSLPLTWGQRRGETSEVLRLETPGFRRAGDSLSCLR
jgi:hypothetical protein